MKKYFLLLLPLFVVFSLSSTTYSQTNSEKQLSEAMIEDLVAYSSNELKALKYKNAEGGYHVKLRITEGIAQGKIHTLDITIYKDNPFRAMWMSGDTVKLLYTLDKNNNIQDASIVNDDTIQKDVKNDEATENHIHDEIASVKQARGKMFQSRGIITGKIAFSTDEIMKRSFAKVDGGFHYLIKMSEGDFKDETIKISQPLYHDDRFRLQWDAGDSVLVGYTLDGDDKMSNPAIYGKDRSLVIIILVILFIGSVLALGRFKGVFSLAALIITILLTFMMFIPIVLSGGSPLLWSIILAILSSVITFILMGGFSKKTLSASIGVIAGFISAALLLLLFGGLLKITGMMQTDMVILLYTENFSVHEILFAGILIGAIGAMMDVAISLASTVEELRKANPDYSPGHLFVASLNVGRDMLGTMINTLILAYVGAALPFIILIYIQYGGGTPLMNILSLEMISQEILRSIIGSLGMVVTIPATAFIASFLKPSKKKQSTK